MPSRFFRHPENLEQVEYWRVIKSSYSNYLEDIRKVDKEGLVENLINTTPNLKVIDLLATPQALRDIGLRLYKEGRKMKGLSVCAEGDSGRWRMEIEADEKVGIDLIGGDLRNSETWDNISKWVGNEKANLIMERGYGGLRYLPTYVHYQRAAMSRLLDMLDPNGGILVLQTPPKDVLNQRGIAIDTWLSKLNEVGVYNRFVDNCNVLDRNVRYGMLILRKNPNAPLLPDIIPYSTFGKVRQK